MSTTEVLEREMTGAVRRPRVDADAARHYAAARADALALRALVPAAMAKMYDPHARRFMFTVRKTAAGQLAPEGLSNRYASIALIGLAADSPEMAAAALHGQSVAEPCGQLVAELPERTGIGDVALAVWALHACRHAGRDAALARLRELNPLAGDVPVVELAWALSALTLIDDARVMTLRNGVRDRLLGCFNAAARVFPHVAGGSRLRSHVACFADQVYPIQALSLVARATGDAEALAAATACGRHICAAQGDAGQWWWHYDARTGRVLEGYPVYAIHQDSMGPMALIALADAGGPHLAEHIARGFAWLKSAPELDGRSLIDTDNGFIWRKVARREPGRLSRYAQASAAALHPSLRVPAIEAIFPPGTIDFEDRPYHLGWLLLTCRLLQEKA